MNKAPTIHDLAADLQISATTVWRALHGHDRISEKTRERVLARAAAIRYVPSLVAQNLSHGRTQTLGVIVPMIGHPVFASLVEKIEETAFAHDYNIILCDARLDLKREIASAQMLLRRRVEGVILIPFARRESGWERPLLDLQKRNIPVVLLEQDLPTPRFSRIVADNYQAAYDITKHLIGLGHRRIAFAFHPVYDWDPVGRQRFEGFNRAMADAGLTAQVQHILDACVFDERNAFHYQPEKVLACFQRRDRPTAVFAGMDLLAIRVMETLDRMRLRIPQDVAVAGFDNIEFSAFTHPPLTTVQQPTEEMGRRAAEILFSLIGRRTTSRPKTTVERLPCRLVIRQSCGAFPPTETP